MDIKDFHDPSWCATLKRLHEEMLQENEFMNEASKFSELTEEDLIGMEKEYLEGENEHLRRHLRV